MPPLKPGQKYPTPTPGFGDRVFYESLLKQRQTSEMAQDWWDPIDATLFHQKFLCMLVSSLLLPTGSTLVCGSYALSNQLQWTVAFQHHTHSPELFVSLGLPSLSWYVLILFSIETKVPELRDLILQESSKTSCNCDRTKTQATHGSNGDICLKEKQIIQSSSTEKETGKERRRCGESREKRSLIESSKIGPAWSVFHGFQ